MLLPCRLKTRISTASSATNMRPSRRKYPMPGWVIFQPATPGQFPTGGDSTTTLRAARPPAWVADLLSDRDLVLSRAAQPRCRGNDLSPGGSQEYPRPTTFRLLFF